MITVVDRGRFDEIRKSLDILGNKESAFLRVELLFYEALSMARAYGTDLQLNSLLAALKNVQQNTYEGTKEVCRTSQQKEKLIRKFIVQFKKAISANQAV